MPTNQPDDDDARGPDGAPMWGDESYIFECTAEDCAFATHARNYRAAVDNAHTHAERTGHTVDVWRAQIRSKVTVDPQGADYFSGNGWEYSEPLGYAGDECPKCGASGGVLRWSSAEVGEPKQVLCNACGAVVYSDA